MCATGPQADLPGSSSLDPFRRKCFAVDRIADFGWRLSRPRC